jgi:hypothetical protein
MPLTRRWPQQVDAVARLRERVLVRPLVLDELELVADRPLVADEAETPVVRKLRISAKGAIGRTVKIERLPMTPAPAENPVELDLLLARRLLGPGCAARMWAARGT